jgi:hypothetical protein
VRSSASAHLRPDMARSGRYPSRERTRVASARRPKALAVHLLRIVVIFAYLAAGCVAALAADDAETTNPVPYATFIASAAPPEHGLFTVWHKNGKVYLELTPAQLDRDFVQTIVPASGLGGKFLVYGNTDHLPAELVRFERTGNSVAIVWPNPAFVAPAGSPASRAIERSFPRSIVGLAKIAAVDAKSGDVIFDAAPFLGDQLNLKAVLQQSLRSPMPMGADAKASAPYELEPGRTYFGKVKSFPNNVVIEALQAWTSEDQHVSDVPADPRHLQMHVVYNIAEPPGDADYRPRLADDRIGIYDDVYLEFGNDDVLTRKLRYIVRWNLQPSDPSRPLSPAKHPMVFYLSDTIPEKYRPAITRAVLKWNAAFEKIGISDALQVREQPNDPNWDPDDIRYNVLRWVTEERPSFGADSQTLYDPRTGQEFRTGILISADVPLHAERDWKYIVDPVRYGRSTDPMPQKFLDDVWLATIMHETGHNLGMQHNFIGSLAYTGKELQDPAFTAQYGVASTVMEYAPLNIWPQPYGQGDYSQTVLGPYDYYLMHWAYGTIPGAATPEAELPTLQHWAQAWSDPKYRYASDEDVSWADGHAADPRAQEGDLTNDPLAWCGVQLGMAHALMGRLDAYFPADGSPYEDESDAFATVFRTYRDCATMPAHTLGGQYLSRAHRGDPGAEPPIVPVPKAQQYRAFQMLDRYLFSSTAWRLPPAVLSHLGYSEWSGYGYVNFEGYGNLPQWAYDPPARHDFSLSEHVAALQSSVMDELFSPAVLGRIVDGPRETSDPHAMTLADLFTWMQSATFAEIRAPYAAETIDPLRRTLQHRYAELLVKLVRAPAPGTPEDAQALARAQLVALDRSCALALRGAALDTTSRAHVQWLRAEAREALVAKHDDEEGTR